MFFRIYGESSVNPRYNKMAPTSQWAVRTLLLSVHCANAASSQEASGISIFNVTDGTVPVSLLSNYRSDECAGGSWRQGDGSGPHGTENYLGQAATRVECIQMVKAQCPNANGATMAESVPGSCYCEMGETYSVGTYWRNCYFDTQCQAGWLQGDGTGGSESYVGSAESHSDCIDMVKEQCPGANGATMNTGSFPKGCWCEYNENNVFPTSSYENCFFIYPHSLLLNKWPSRFAALGLKPLLPAPLGAAMFSAVAIFVVLLGRSWHTHTPDDDVSYEHFSASA